MSPINFPGIGFGGGGASSFSALAGSISLTQIPDALITEAKLNAAVTAKLAGSAAHQHSRYGDATKGSTNTNIVKFGTALGTPDTSIISHNDSTYLTEGSIFTILEAGTYIINVATSAATSGFGLYILTGTTVDNTLQTICGGETQPTNGSLCSFSNSRKLNFDVGDKIWVYCNTTLTNYTTFNYLHSISIVKLTKGQKGDTGPAGSPTTFLDGSLAADAAVASITGITGRKNYKFTATGISNAGSNRIFFTVNGDTTEAFTDGRQLLNATNYTTTTDALLMPTTVGNGVAFTVTGEVRSIFDGTNTHIFVETVGHFSNSDSLRWIGHKQISGNVDLTSFSIRSNQTNGFKSGMILKAQEAP